MCIIYWIYLILLCLSVGWWVVWLLCVVRRVEDAKNAVALLRPDGHDVAKEVNQKNDIFDSSSLHMIYFVGDVILTVTELDGGHYTRSESVTSRGGKFIRFGRYTMIYIYIYLLETYYCIQFVCCILGFR